MEISRELGAECEGPDTRPARRRRGGDQGQTLAQTEGQPQTAEDQEREPTENGRERRRDRSPRDADPRCHNAPNQPTRAGNSGDTRSSATGFIGNTEDKRAVS